MRRSEEAIEKVLAGLRDSSAAPGMEGRIMKAVQDRKLRAESGWELLGSMWSVTASRRGARGSWAWVLAVAGLAGVVVAVSVSHVPGIRRIPVVPARPLRTANLPMPVPVAAIASVEVAGKIRSSASGSVTRSRGKVVRWRVDVVERGDALAVREMRAASRPAPPAPLTEQEKLLLRVAHRGDPGQMAMLNPEIRARREAEGETEFEKFFEESESETRDNE